MGTQLVLEEQVFNMSGLENFSSPVCWYFLFSLTLAKVPTQVPTTITIPLLLREGVSLVSRRNKLHGIWTMWLAKNSRRASSFQLK
jgi:hypothetical protein